MIAIWRPWTRCKQKRWEREKKRKDWSEKIQKIINVHVVSYSKTENHNDQLVRVIKHKQPNSTSFSRQIHRTVRFMTESVDTKSSIKRAVSLLINLQLFFETSSVKISEYEREKKKLSKLITTTSCHTLAPTMNRITQSPISCRNSGDKGATVIWNPVLATSQTIGCTRSTTTPTRKCPRIIFSRKVRSCWRHRTIWPSRRPPWFVRRWTSKDASALLRQRLASFSSSHIRKIIRIFSRKDFIRWLERDFIRRWGTQLCAEIEK